MALTFAGYCLRLIGANRVLHPPHAIVETQACSLGAGKCWNCGAPNGTETSAGPPCRLHLCRHNFPRCVSAVPGATDSRQIRAAALRRRTIGVEHLAADVS